MNKVVYNACYGGFGLSDKAKKWLREHGVADPYGLERHTPMLVQCVEKLGEKANGTFSELRVAEIEGDKYWIENYDGYEAVHTPETMDWVVIKEEKK